MYDRQRAFEFWRLGDGYMVAEGGDLVTNTLKGVAVPTSVDNKAPRDGGAFGLVADKFDVHNLGFYFFIPILVVDADEGAAEGEYFAEGDEDGVMDLSQWRAKEARH